MDETSSLRNKMQVAVPWALAAALLRMGLSLVGMILLVRYLEPAEYGVWALLLGLSGPIYLFVSFGFQHNLTRFLPALDDRGQMARVVWPIVIRRILWMALASTVLILAFPLFGAWIGLEGYFDHLAVYQLALICNVGVMYATVALSARFLQREVLWMTVPQQALSVVLTVAGIQLGMDLLFFVAVTSALAAMNLVWCLFLLVREFGAPIWSALWRTFPEVGEERSYRRASYAGDYGATFLNTEVDRYLIALFSQSAEVAVYAVATTIVERLRTLLPTQLFRPLMEASFFRRYEETGQVSEVARMFRLLLLIIAAICFLFVAIFVPLGSEMLAVVFRSEYEAGYWIVVVYLVTMALHQMPAGLILKALKRADVLVYAQSAVALNLLLGLLLVPRFGGIGMALGTATSVTVKNMIMYLWAKRLMDVRLPWLGLLKTVAAAGTAAASISALKGWTAWDDVTTILVYVPVAALVYALLLRVFSPLDAQQRSLLVAAMPPSVARPLSIMLG